MSKFIYVQIKNSIIYLLILKSLFTATNCDKKPILIQKKECDFFIFEEEKMISLDRCKLYDGKSAFSNWSQCSRKCCQRDLIDQFPTISYSALSACDPLENTLSKDTIFMIGKICIGISMAILSVILLTILRNFLMSRQKINILCTQQSKELQQLQRSDHLTTKIEEIKWIEQEQSESKLADPSNSCSICLEEDCDTVIFCSHYYHAYCISSWLEKKRSCPLCQKSRIGLLKIYCKDCHAHSFTCEHTIILKAEWRDKLRCRNCENRPELSRWPLINQIVNSKTSLCEHH